MRKTLTPILGGLSFLLALPLLAVGYPGIGPGGCMPPPDYLNKTTHVDLHGKLQFRDLPRWLSEELVPVGPMLPSRIMRPPQPQVRQWEISSNGQTYRLDFGGSQELLALVGKLADKSVLVTGTVEEWMSYRNPLPDGGNGRGPVPLILYLPVKVKVVRVKTIQAIDVDSVRETVQVEARGTLDFQSDGTEPMYPRTGYSVTIDGSRYPLEFGADGRLAMLAKQLRGQKVVVRGRLETRKSLVGFPERMEVQTVLVVTDLQAAPLVPPLWREPAVPFVR